MEGFIHLERAEPGFSPRNTGDMALIEERRLRDKAQIWGAGSWGHKSLLDLLILPDALDNGYSQLTFFPGQVNGAGWSSLRHTWIPAPRFKKQHQGLPCGVKRTLYTLLVGAEYDLFFLNMIQHSCLIEF